MERNFYTDDFERLLKERSDEFRMYPSKRVWHSIYNDLHPGRKWPSVAVSLLLIAALLITGYWNSNNHTTTSIVASSNNLHTGIAGQVNYSAPVTQQAVVLNTYNPNANNTVAIISSKQNAVNAVTNSNIGNANSASVIVYSSNTKRTAEKRAYNRIVDNNGNSNTSAAQNSMLIYSGQINTLSVNTAFNTTFNSGNSVSTTDKATSKNTDLPNGVKSNSAVVNTKSAADLIPVNTKTAANENNIDAGISTIPVDKINDIPIVESVVQSGSDQKIEAAVVTIAIDTKVKAAGQLTLSTQDKAWMDDYAFYNRSTRKKWKDRVAKEFISHRVLASEVLVTTLHLML
jgi:hypothetical protein